KVALEPLRKAAESDDAEVVSRAKPALVKLEQLLCMPLPQSAIRLLVKRRADGAEEALLRHAPFAEEEDVEVEIYYGLNDLVQKRGTLPAVLRRALADPEPARRAVAGCLAGWRGSDGDRAAVRKLLEDRDA